MAYLGTRVFKMLSMRPQQHRTTGRHQRGLVPNTHITSERGGDKKLSVHPLHVGPQGEGMFKTLSVHSQLLGTPSKVQGTQGSLSAHSQQACNFRAWGN